MLFDGQTRENVFMHHIQAWLLVLVLKVSGSGEYHRNPVIVTGLN